LSFIQLSALVCQ